jgi:hypothetical protein
MTETQLLMIAMGLFQAVMSVVLMLGAFALNAVRDTLKEISEDFKRLNNKVLEDYVTRDQWESRNAHVIKRLDELRQEGLYLHTAVEVIAMKLGVELPRR